MSDASSKKISTKQAFFVRKSRSPNRSLRPELSPKVIDSTFDQYEKMMTTIMRSPTPSPTRISLTESMSQVNISSKEEQDILPEIDDSYFALEDTKASCLLESGILEEEEDSAVLVDAGDIDFSPSDEICAHESIIKDKGMNICENCGMELYEECTHEQEWRYFGDNDSRGGDPTRCQYRKSPEKGIKKELERMGFPPDICQLADELYMMITNGEIKRSFLRKGIMFACVYESYKMKKKPKTPEDLQSKFFDLNRKGMSQGLTYYRLRCLKVGSLVTLSDGTAIPIEAMTTNQEVWGFSGEKAGLVSTSQTNFVNSGEKECIELTFLDGRTLSCTPDHKLLTSTGEWKEAQELFIGTDKIGTGPSGFWMESEKFNYAFDIGYLKMNVSDDLTSRDTKKAMALCRIIGYLISHGFNGEYTSELYFHYHIDLQTALRDIELFGNLGSVSPSHLCDSIYTAKLPSSIYIQQLFPLQLGGNRSNSIPSFIFEATTPLILVREFIAGLLGGSDDIFSSGFTIGLAKVLSGKNVQGMLTEWTALSDLLRTRFGINSTIELADYAGMTSFNLVFAQIHDAVKFGEKIGVRYCHQNILRVNALMSYWNYKEIVTTQRDKLIISATAISKFERRPYTYIWNAIRKGLRRAIYNLQQTQNILPESIPTIRTIRDARRLKAYKKPFQTRIPRLGFRDYMKLIAASEFFTGDPKLINRYNTALPLMSLPVIARRTIGTFQVYDITVTSPFSSFLAAGIVCHNCPRQHFETEDISTKHFIPKFMEKFNAKKEHIDKVILLFEKIKDACPVINRSNPQSASKAIVYYYLRRKGVPIGPAKFGRIVALSEVIVMRLSLEISRVLGTSKTVDLG